MGRDEGRTHGFLILNTLKEKDYLCFMQVSLWSNFFLMNSDFEVDCENLNAVFILFHPNVPSCLVKDKKKNSQLFSMGEGRNSF